MAQNKQTNDMPQPGNSDKTLKYLLVIACILGTISLLIAVFLLGQNSKNTQQSELPKLGNQSPIVVETQIQTSATEPKETVHAHTWSEWNVLTDASCTQPGSETRRCSLCGETETEEIPQKEHTWKAATWHTPSYCTSCQTRHGTADIAVGETVTLGRYEQDNFTANGSEPIEWQVLSIHGDRALLISKYALDAQAYNDQYEDAPWESCDLRRWLNDYFVRAAFDGNESQLLLKTYVNNGADQGNRKYIPYDEKDTEDYVFLLSYAELLEYFPSASSRACMNTAYAAAQASANISGSYNGSVRSCWWWLRSPGDTLHAASTVFPDKENTIDAVSNTSGCVRPAIWVDINSPDIII